jgi:dihydrofolate synthase/folylpolyglutamate synthase
MTWLRHSHGPAGLPRAEADTVILSADELPLGRTEPNKIVMSYQNAVARMYALGHELAHMPSHKFDLAHMRVLLAALEHPEQRFPSVLIAGTNGKGSTAATLASILKASGLRTGLYTSPHLIRINERIQINGEQISDDDFALLHDVLDRTAERLVIEGELPSHPSFFEMLTALAFEYFSRQRIDLAVLEVGMGGRLDATNIVQPRISVITDISLDHQKFLGNTITEIAREKVGIIRPSGVVVTLPQQPEANHVIGNKILEMSARGLSAVSYVPPVSPASPQYLVAGTRRENRTTSATYSSPNSSRQESGVFSREGRLSRYPLQVMGREVVIETPLLGRHQLRNVALAIRTAEELAKQGFPVTPAAVERGARETRWPGRFQIVPATEESPQYVFDVAHNPAGAWALRSTLSACFPDREFVLIFGAMLDKAIGEMGEILFPMASRVILTRAENPRAAAPEEIQAAIRVTADCEPTPDVGSALERARALAGSNGLVVITGSIYVIGEAMKKLGLKP